MEETVDESTSRPFDVASCTKTLVRACQAAGYYAGDATLIRLGENAIFHLVREGLVARIARGLDVFGDSEKEIRVARWLIKEGVHAAAPSDIDQPLIVDDRPVTFWHFVDHLGTEATPSELGSVLRTLHRLHPPTPLRLPRHDMFGRVDARIRRAVALPENDREFLRSRLTELRELYTTLVFPLRPCAVHGDAHTGNLLRLSDGTTSLIDLERFAYGQPETDLVVTAVERRVGWSTERDYESFVDAYGFDVASWDGFPVLQAISELKMTTWLMQNLGHGTTIDDEIRLRLDDLRSPDKPRHWSPF